MHMLGTAEAAKTALQILAHGYAPQEGDYRSKEVYMLSKASVQCTFLCMQMNFSAFSLFFLLS